MPRVFLSHSSRDSRQAMAVKAWLIEQEPGLAEEIFLDLDPHTGIRPGERWKQALQQANNRCEAVICLLSKHWEASHECRDRIPVRRDAEQDHHHAGIRARGTAPRWACRCAWAGRLVTGLSRTGRSRRCSDLSSAGVRGGGRASASTLPAGDIGVVNRPRLCHRSGLLRVDILPIEHDFWRFYRLVP